MRFLARLFQVFSGVQVRFTEGLRNTSFSDLYRTLTAEIFSSLLFPYTSECDDMDEQDNEQSAITKIPVLDEPTRRELHGLVLLLSSDIDTLQTIVQMTLEALDQGM